MNLYLIYLIITWALLFALNIYDVYSTYILLNLGYNEANPIVRWFIEIFGVDFSLLFIKLLTFSYLTIITIKIIIKKFNNIEKISILLAYIIVIIYYSYFLYNYNYQFMLELG